MTALAEDYLRTIYYLSDSDEETTVRVKEVADELGTIMVTVSRGTDFLAKKGLLQKDKYRGVRLTRAGKEMGKALFERYNALCRFFHEVLRVDPEIAEKDARNVEHRISPEVYQAIRRHLE
jgi:DtxR family Mn-dependent transcriptional regulator